MGVLKDLLAAVKGGANEVGEAIIDANAIRILEQEIRDAESAINSSKQSLTRMKSTDIRLKREIHALSEDIKDYEQKAITALEADEEELAVEVAERIAEIESEHNEKSTEQVALEREIDKIHNRMPSEDSDTTGAGNGEELS